MTDGDPRDGRTPGSGGAPRAEVDEESTDITQIPIDDGGLAVGDVLDDALDAAFDAATSPPDGPPPPPATSPSTPTPTVTSTRARIATPPAIPRTTTPRPSTPPPDEPTDEPTDVRPPPVKPAAGAPVKPAAGAPVKPAAMAPVKPAAVAPVKPAAVAPVKPPVRARVATPPAIPRTTTPRPSTPPPDEPTDVRPPPVAPRVRVATPPAIPRTLTPRPAPSPTDEPTDVRPPPVAPPVIARAATPRPATLRPDEPTDDPADTPTNTTTNTPTDPHTSTPTDEPLEEPTDVRSIPAPPDEPTSVRGAIPAPQDDAAVPTDTSAAPQLTDELAVARARSPRPAALTRAASPARGPSARASSPVLSALGAQPVPSASPEEIARSRARVARAVTPPPDEIRSDGSRASSPAIANGGRAPSEPAADALTTDAPAARLARFGTDAGAQPRSSPSLAIRIAQVLPWVIVALPAVYQIALLATAIGGRIAYPYDLEWMEGGMLHHALRIQEGKGLYVPPTIGFIPYLYTPLYPSLIALLGGAFGITYALGRTISVVSLVGLALISVGTVAGHRDDRTQLAPAIAGSALGIGLFAAAYPYMEGWYDLVRADTLFLLLVTAGIAGLPRWARSGHGLAGHGKVAAGAALLAIAFFCKQTGIIYVAFGGLVVLVCAWRRVPAYVAAAGALGLGGTWLLQQATDGWFWIYIREIHAAHDFNMDRFWKSFGNILWHFPAMTVVVVTALVVVAVTRIVKGTLPRGAYAVLLWAPAFAVSTLIGAVGWGTEFAHFNAYMPAFLHGGIAAAAAVLAIHACAREWCPASTKGMVLTTVIALAAAAPLAYTCWTTRWEPGRFVPTTADADAGDKLIRRLAAIEGELWVPSHPWYLALAGKTPRVHRMGIKDVTWRQTRVVDGLEQALTTHGFAAIVLDQRDVHVDLPWLFQAYRPALKLPADERPRLYSGAKVVPDSIWLPAIPASPPAGARVLFDFERASWDAWSPSGPAWGSRPAAESLPGQGLVLGASGRAFATSMHGGDAALGRITSPTFQLDGTIALKLGGGADATKLRVELWVDDQLIGVASAPVPGGGTLRATTIDPGPHLGKPARLVLVDDSPTGHLDVDDVWLVPARR